MGDLPGKSFVQMFGLTYANNFAKKTCSDRLLIAIFWEETLFNNTFQRGGGTAVGFGQTEPSEFDKIRHYGVALPPVRKVGKKVFSTRPLTDREAVHAAAAFIHEMAKRQGSLFGALKAYAGYYWARDNPDQTRLTAADRLKLIQGWRDCETHLRDVRPFRRPAHEEEDIILDGLQKSRKFAPLRERFRPVLFPPSHYR